MNSNSGSALVRPLIGIGAAVILIVCFFLPWAAQGAYAASLWDFATKSNSSDAAWPIIYLLTFGGTILAIVGAGVRAAGSATATISPTARRALSICWVVGFAMAIGGIAYYLIKLSEATSSYNSYYGYTGSSTLSSGYGVWLAIAAALVGLVAGAIDMLLPGEPAWAAPYGAQPYGAQPFGAPGYGPSAQEAWAAPQAPAQVYPPAGGYAAAATTGRLTYVEGGHPSTIMVNPGEQLLVDRDSAARIRLSDPKVSRQHAMISRSGNDWVVRDLGATNPTRLIGASGGSGAVIQGEIRVPSGQLLIGDVLVTLYPA